MLLDATKAFDRVHFIKMFNELLKKDLCPMICKFLAYQYAMQKCRVRWCSKSNYKQFSATNGVTEGGVLSPILFTIYMDVLLQRLKSSGVGCYIGHVFAGAFGYADDIILLAPTRSSMDIMISICEEFSEEFSILFNATKSRHLFFSKKNISTKVKFQMQGATIPTVENEKHLGNMIGKNGSNKSVKDSVSELYKNTNLLMSQFSKCNIDVKYKLFKSYCMSVYGSQRWDFSNRICETFYIAWRKCIRRLLGVPYNTHSNLLPLICNDIPVEIQLMCRFINFVRSCSKSQCMIVKICSKLAVKGSRSALSNSWSYVCKILNVDRSNDIQISNLKAQYFNNQTEDNLITGALIYDMLSLNHTEHDNELMELIAELCTC